MRLPERLKLAHLPTPIHHLGRLSAQVGHQIWVWRDDQTGGLEAGNKIRKLEFLLAEAAHQGADHLVTCGGPQSNHARATVCAARRLGLSVTVVIREPRQGFDPVGCGTGNLLIDRLAGAELEILSYKDYAAAGGTYLPFLEAAAERLRRAGRRPYIVPEGGSSALGAIGYVAAVEEMLATWRGTGPGTSAPDTIWCALGSGGTFAGLLLGAARFADRSTEVHAVNVCDDAPYFERRVGGILDEARAAFGLPEIARPLRIHDGHVGAGYALASDDDLRFYARLMAQEGLLLDPAYTGKAFQGMLAALGAPTGGAPQSATHRHHLFLHSGGQLATFAYAAQYHRALALTPPTSGS